MAYVSAGSGLGATPPALPTGQQTGGPANPVITPNFDKTVTALVKKEILQNLRNVTRWLVPGAYIEGRIIPGTNLIRHIAYGDLPQNDSLIAVEGVAPTDIALTIGYEEYSVQQRGRLVGLSDVALQLSPHELMAVAADRVSYDALWTIDRSIATSVFAGASPLVLPVAGTGLAATDIRKWVAMLKSARIPTFPDGFYLCMIHPNSVFDLQSDTSIGGWIEASKYADPSRLLNGEIGRMYGVRFIETTVGTWNSVAGAGNDTYREVVFGPDYFAFGDLQSVETYMVRPGGDHADPLAQKALVGYKGMWGSRVLDVAETTVTVPGNPNGVRYGTTAAHTSGAPDITP